MQTLNEIGLKYKTDKSTITHGYLDTYEHYLAPWRDKEFTLLEIGVAAGNSIKMWKEYFANAHIYGIDNNPDCLAPDVFIGDQTDSQFLATTLLNTGTPDIIIDDGSHYGPHTIATFRELFPKLTPGGYYVVEDTHCFYCPTYGPAPAYGSGMSDVWKFFTALASHVDVHGRGMTGNTEYAINLNIQIPPVPEFSRIWDSIHIHPSLWWLKRKG